MPITITSPGCLPILDLAAMEQDMQRRETLPLADPDHPRGFKRDHDERGWDIWWGGYEYFIEDKRIRSPERLLGWVEHFGGKSWKGLTPWRIAEFIRAVASHNGWNVGGM